MIDAATAQAVIAAARDAEDTVTVTLVDGTEVVGTPVSINSKGVNVKVDGKTKSVTLSKVDTMSPTTPIEAAPAEDIPADGMTTRQVAEILEIEAKELRVYLRKLGRGVGKGKKYGLGAADVDAVRAAMVAEATEADATADA